MRIGIDAREVCGRATGVGRYLSGLLHDWSRSDRARPHEFVLYAHEPLAFEFDASRFALRHVPGKGGARWEQQLLPRTFARDHLDVFFGPGYTAPLLTRVPLVVAMHDISFIAHPEWFRAREGLRRRYLGRRTARKARAIVTISEFSKREIVDLLKIAPERIHVIPPGITSPVPSPQSPAPSPQSPAPSPQPRVLFVGSIFNRRHLPDLLRAFAQVVKRHPTASLDIVGDNRTYPFEDLAQMMATLGLERHARWHQYVSDADLSALYRQARAFAFLSEYEGLGLTPLEALAVGIPSVLLDTPVARESCGDAALYVANGDIAAIAAGLDRLLTDAAVRTRLLAAAPAVLTRYDWRRAATDTLQVLEASA